MKNGKRTISGQLRIGDNDLRTHLIPDILARIDAAQKLAGMNRVLFLPSRDKDINQTIVKHCRKQGLEVFLWYKVLTDNVIMPERSELGQDAFGGNAGESGVWNRIFQSDETYLFACPTNEKYASLLLNRCRQKLDAYDGLFADCIGYPLPSLGLEAIFTCFCASCRAREPRLKEWAVRVREMRESIESATDEDLERWGTFAGQARVFGLTGFYSYRTRLITALAERYASLAREMGKEFGLDVLAPALSFFAGHDYAALGEFSDWLKPRIYLHTFGPSSIPLEYYCMGIGGSSWARRVSMPVLMRFISRSIGLDMPHSLHNLTQSSLTGDAAQSQIRQAVRMTGTAVHPGIECSRHPEFDSDVDEHTIRSAAKATAEADCPGAVLAWNLLYMPDSFLRIVGDALLT